MKKLSIISFLLIASVSFSQKKVVKKMQTNADEINIYTAGLDNLVLENSQSDFIEVFLYAESYDEQLIKIESLNKQVNIKFEFEGTETREVIFRKYITKRLQRAYAILKVPKDKKVFIFGENVDIESKSYKNELAIYIENGIVKLNTIKANTTLKLYSGNVYGNVKNIGTDIISKLGGITVDDTLFEKEYHQKFKNQSKNLSILTSKGNIYLNTKTD